MNTMKRDFGIKIKLQLISNSCHGISESGDKELKRFNFIDTRIIEKKKPILKSD